MNSFFWPPDEFKPNADSPFTSVLVSNNSGEKYQVFLTPKCYALLTLSVCRLMLGKDLKTAAQHDANVRVNKNIKVASC